MSSHHIILEICGVRIAVEAAFPIAVTERYVSYLTEQKPDYTAVITLVDELPVLNGKRIVSQLGYDVYADETGAHQRIFFDEKHDRRPYAAAFYDFAQHKIQILCLRADIDNVNHLRGAFFHLAWEEIMLLEHRLIVHACLVADGQDGILFSGPSGIGKSTQGELWSRYTDAHVINGDRPILLKAEDGWIACGSPYAGSSEYFLNEQVPVRSVVMLRKAKECRIRRMRPAEAFQALWPGLTVSDWDESLASLASKMCAEAAQEIPFYALDCTPDRESVMLVQSVLMKAGACSG